MPGLKSNYISKNCNYSWNVKAIMLWEKRTSKLLQKKNLQLFKCHCTFQSSPFFFFFLIFVLFILLQNFFNQGSKIPALQKIRYQEDCSTTVRAISLPLSFTQWNVCSMSDIGGTTRIFDSPWHPEIIGS